MKYFGKNFIFSVKSTNFLFFRDQIYIFVYKTTLFIQNLYILMKYFGKNFIFSVKSTIFFNCLGPNVHFWVQNYSVYPKFVHFSENCLAKLHFWSKKDNFLFFRTNCTFLGTKLHFLSNICTFWSNFLAKTSFLE